MRPEGLLVGRQRDLFLNGLAGCPPRPFFCFANVENLASVYELTGDFTKVAKGGAQ